MYGCLTKSVVFDIMFGCLNQMCGCMTKKLADLQNMLLLDQMLVARQNVWLLTKCVAAFKKVWLLEKWVLACQNGWLLKIIRTA